MILFKDVALSIDSDLEKAKQVQVLKSSLGPRGILYRSFGGDDDLRESVFRCMGVLIANHVNGQIATTPSPEPIVDSSESIIIDDNEICISTIADELGILDYAQIIEDHITKATKASLVISNAMQELTAATTQATEGMSLAAAAENQLEKKKIINDVAKAIDFCADIFERNANEVHVEFRHSLDAIRELIDIQISDLSREQSGEEVSIIFDMTKSLEPTITETMQQTADFGSSIAGLPRLTKELNAAKRRLQRAVESLVSGLSDVRSENNALHAYAASKIGVDE